MREIWMPPVRGRAALAMSRTSGGIDDSPLTCTMTFPGACGGTQTSTGTVTSLSRTTARFEPTLKRRELTPSVARAAHERLERAPIERRRPRRLGTEAWRLADKMGTSETFMSLEELMKLRELDKRRTYG